MRKPFLCIALVLSMLFAIPSVASAAAWSEGTAGIPFDLADSGGLLVSLNGDDPTLVVPYVAMTSFDGASIGFEPRSLREMSDGSLLVSTGTHGTILRLSKAGQVLQQYTNADIAGLRHPFDAVPLPDGGMLIVDRAATQGGGRVIRVDASLNTVWSYGGVFGLGAGQVYDPSTAQPLAGGHTLICDSLGSRVIEVDDVTGAIVWSYGAFKLSGTTAGRLVQPDSAERLSNGDTLICDTEANKVIEVTPSKKIVWSYGTGVAGRSAGQLANPNSATRLSNGDTLISDSGNDRVLEVDKSGKAVQNYGVSGLTPDGGALSDPRAALRLTDGSTIIADLGNTRLATYNYVAKHTFTATSNKIDPLSGARKRFIAIRRDATVPTDTVLAVEYSINSGHWVSLHGTTLPSNAIGTNIRYRVSMSTNSSGRAPSLRSISVEWVVAGASGSSGSGSSGSGSGSSGSGGSGTSTSLSGSGAGSSTTSVPGTGTSIGSGTSAGTSTGSGGVAASGNVSGWLMSEVKNGSSGTSDSGPGLGGISSDTTVPGLALLAIMYTTGLAWSPASRLVARLITAVMSH